MRTPCRLALAAVLAGALLAHAAAPPARAPRLAMVDLTVIFRDYKAAQDLMEELARNLRESLDQLEALQREISAIRRSMQDYAMGTPERLAQEEKLAEKARVARMLSMEAQTKESSLRARMLKSIYADAMEAVEAYALEHDLDLVLKQQSFRLPGEERDEPASTAEAVHELSQRTVLFAKPEFDITAPILEAMNAAYDRRQAGGGGAP